MRAQPPAALPALAWRPSGFALVESRGGSYEVLATWGEADDWPDTTNGEGAADPAARAPGAGFT